MDKPTVLSCIQPSGDLHLGNYFGAVSNWVKLQDRYRCIYGVVDLHAMTKPPYDPRKLQQFTYRIFADLLACGIDPQKSILFIQSLVPEHTELCWILSCVASYGDLTRQTQFKDQFDQYRDKKFISAGFFNYPVLQAADILIYGADFVPVGRDQEQHLELARDIGKRFNSYFGEYFREPQVLLTDTPKIRSSADPNQKMSKSLGPKHYIGLFEAADSVRAKIRSAVTDTGILPPGVYMSSGVENLFEILKACGKQSEADALLKEYDAGVRQYRRLKEVVSDAVVELTDTFRARRADIVADRASVKRTAGEMSAAAREIARKTLAAVRQRVGLPKL